MLKKHYSIFIITAVLFTVFLTNFSSGNFITGWDNLQTELNNGINLKRAIFSVWEEYQGLGLLPGNAHAADLPRQIMTYFLSLLSPLNLVRQINIFSMLALGTFGAYFLIKKIILEQSLQNDFKKQFVTMLGAFFYLFNLSTIQTFYVPYEAFVSHFAALPWFLLFSLLFYKNPSRKNGLILTAVLFIGATANFIPTLFLVYIISLIILMTVLIFFNRNKKSLGSILKLFSITFIANAFWLLPFIYFTLTNAGVTLNAKINQMSTENVFLQNKVFGNIQDVMLLKGFWLNNVDPNSKGQFAYMMGAWRQFLSVPAVEIIGILVFLVILVGVVFSIRIKKPILLAFLLLLIFSFSMLSTNIPPFSWVDVVFRKIPLFEQAFRFPFTKFSILLSLMYSIFFAIGATNIVIRIKKANFYGLAIVFLILPIIIVSPVFSGNLFYNKEKVLIPKEYFQTFDYFKNQDPNTRIANLPQYTFWGWNYYNWGYGGSGFLWYGIKQPILDRAFDVWSRADENYYWELSNALYSQNPKTFEAVLNKYQINWLLVDKNIIDPSSPETLFYTGINSLIKQVPSIGKTASFGNIDIYKVSLKNNPKSFVFTAGHLKSANNYQWGNFDKAYLDLGNYTSPADNKQPNVNVYYPFRSLLSNKNQNNEEFKIVNETNSLAISNPLPEGKNMVLNIPSFTQNEEIIPASVITEINPDNSLTLSIFIQTPKVIIINGKISNTVYSQNIKKPILNIPANYPNTITVNINGIENFSLNYKDGPKNIGSGFLSLKQDNLIVASDNTGVLQTDTIKGNDITSSLDRDDKPIALSDIAKNSVLEVKIPKISDGYENFEANPSQVLVNQVKNCDNFNKGPFSASVINNEGGKMLQLTSQNSTACLSLYMPNLIHSLGYALFIKNTNIQGRGLHTWLLNEDEKFSSIDTYLNQRKNETATFIIPPQEKFGRAYSLHLENISIGNDKTINDVGNIFLFPIPYNFITAIKMSPKGIALAENTQSVENFTVSHPNETYYLIKGLKGSQALILSQSYDEGWKAYQISLSNGPLKFLQTTFPFIFASEIKNHVLVNNWENGWALDLNVDKNSEIAIVYWPQYLEFLGFLIIAVVTLFFIIRLNS